MNLIDKYYNETLYYEIDGFAIDEKMKHLFSTRIGWDQDKIFDNLSEIWSLANDNIYRLKQVHGREVLPIKGQDLKEVANKEYDGLLTNIKNIGLSTYHADCIPLYFYDPKKEVVGLAHAGWKGTLNNIGKEMILAMEEIYKSERKDIRLAIGPSIGPCCYEIGPDVESLFRDKYGDKDIITYREEKIFLDLWRANYINLLEEAIRKDNIYHSNFCSSCNVDTLFSYRKENGTKNRMIASIMLKK